MPVFVEQHPKLREVWIKKWEELVVNSFDISEVYNLFCGCAARHFS